MVFAYGYNIQRDKITSNSHFFRFPIDEEEEENGCVLQYSHLIHRGNLNLQLMSLLHETNQLILQVKMNLFIY